MLSRALHLVQPSNQRRSAARDDRWMESSSRQWSNLWVSAVYPVRAAWLLWPR